MHMRACPLPVCPLPRVPYRMSCRGLPALAPRREGRPAAGVVSFNSIHSSTTGGRLYGRARPPPIGWEGSQRPPRNPLRTFVSAAAVLVGLLMAAVAVPAMWVDRNIVQEEGFVALTAPLGKDPAFQQRLATAAVDSLASAAQIPEPLTELARPVLDSAAQSLTGLPGYSDAWAETLRKSHRLTFADPSTLPPEADGTSSLTLDVAPLVGLVAKQVSDATTLPLQAPGQVLIHIGPVQPAPARSNAGHRLRPDGLRRRRRRRHRLRAGARCGPTPVDRPGRHRRRCAGARRGYGSWAATLPAPPSPGPRAATMWRSSSRTSLSRRARPASASGSSLPPWRERPCWSWGSLSALPRAADRGRIEHR